MNSFVWSAVPSKDLRYLKSRIVSYEEVLVRSKLVYILNSTQTLIIDFDWPMSFTAIR